MRVKPDRAAVAASRAVIGPDVVDTNIFRGSPMLRSRVWDSVAAHRDEWKTQVVVPEVAVVETVNMMRVEWEKTLAAVEILHVGEFGLSGLQQEMAERIRAYSDACEQSGARSSQRAGCVGCSAARCIRRYGRG